MKVLKGILYWLWQCTYGVLMTAIGAVVVLVLICCGCKPKRFHYNIYIEVGKNWGGVNLGAAARGGTWLAKFMVGYSLPVCDCYPIRRAVLVSRMVL